MMLFSFVFFFIILVVSNSSNSSARNTEKALDVTDIIKSGYANYHKKYKNVYKKQQ